MKNLFVISALMFGLVGTLDAAQSKAEAEVETAFAKYFQARKDQDYKTVVAMESKTGTLNTNSDGSFHKPMNKQSEACLLYTSPSPRDQRGSRMPSSA